MSHSPKRLAALTAAATLTATALTGCSSAAKTSTSGSATGSKLTNATLLTGYVYGPEYAGFFAARDLGYYKSAGLNVTINAGQGSTSNAQLLATQKVDFAEVAGTALVESVAKGAPLKMIAGIQENAGAGVAVVPSITTPTQLSGKTFTGSAYDFGTTLYPIFAKKVGITDFHVVDVDPSSIPQIFIAGKAEAMTADGWAEVPEMKAQGVKFNYFSYADYGLNTVGPGIVVNTSFLRKNPKEAKAFVAATMKGFSWVYANPAKAASLMSKDVPSIKLNVAQATMTTLKQYSYTPATKDKPLGCLAASDWTQTINIVREAGLVKGSLPPASKLYTNLVSGC